MSNTRKANGGYVLVYVLVAITIASLVCVVAITGAMRNLKTQQAAVEYTRDKYVAEGNVERFVAEFQEAAKDLPGTSYSEENDVDNAINSIVADLNVKIGLEQSEDLSILDRMEDIDIEISSPEEGSNGLLKIGEKKYIKDENDSETLIEIRYPVAIEIIARGRMVQVDAVANIEFTVKVAEVDGKTIFNIWSASFGYSKYDLSMVMQENN